MDERLRMAIRKAIGEELLRQREETGAYLDFDGNNARIDGWVDLDGIVDAIRKVIGGAE